MLETFMETLQNILIILAVLVVGFWHFGGFKLLKWFKVKRLDQQIQDPLNTPELKSQRDQLAATQNIRLQQSFTTYAIQQKITHNDRWPKVAFEHDPENPVAVYFYAAFLLKEAWAIRGTGTANKLSADTIEKFRNKLAEAETLLKPLLKQLPNPADAVFLILEIYLALGQRAEAEFIIKQYSDRLKDRLDIAIKDLKMLYPRWGGSHEKLQALAEQYSLQAGAMIATKAYAYCHFIEDEEESAVKAWLKTKPLSNLINQYQHLPKAPPQIASYEDYNLLLAHKLFAKLFFYTNNNAMLKQAIQNTSGHFAADEVINPNTKDEITFIEMAKDLGVTSFL
jgi:Tetratricopeptide repeat